MTTTMGRDEFLQAGIEDDYQPAGEPVCDWCRPEVLAVGEVDGIPLCACHLAEVA